MVIADRGPWQGLGAGMPRDCRRTQLCSCYDLAKFGHWQRYVSRLRAHQSSATDMQRRETLPISLAVQTRLSRSVGLPRVLDMRGHMGMPRGPCRPSNLPKALCAAARAMLDEAGPDAVILREAARRVGVSATAAYRHFANKEELLASVGAEGFRELAAAMEWGATGSDPLGGVGVAYFDFALQKPGLFRLMFGPILVARAKYPELNDAASAVFGLLQRVAVSDNEWPREDDVAGMAAWGLVMASPP